MTKNYDTIPTLVSEYGVPPVFIPTQQLPPAFKPAPTKDDYTKRYISRTVVVRRNDESDCREISPSMTSLVNSDIYQTFFIEWKISGTRDKTIVNGIIEDFGVADSNKSSLQKVPKVVSRLLNNSLEFWRGY